jgi:hypothetical protein
MDIYGLDKNWHITDMGYQHIYETEIESIPDAVLRRVIYELREDIKQLNAESMALEAFRRRHGLL